MGAWCPAPLSGKNPPTIPRRRPCHAALARCSRRCGFPPARCACGGSSGRWRARRTCWRGCDPLAQHSVSLAAAARAAKEHFEYRALQQFPLCPNCRRGTKSPAQLRPRSLQGNLACPVLRQPLFFAEHLRKLRHIAVCRIRRHFGLGQVGNGLA
jgi:hypothetical protein